MKGKPNIRTYPPPSLKMLEEPNYFEYAELLDALTQILNSEIQKS